MNHAGREGGGTRKSGDTVVVNLRTGDIRVYSLPPRAALINAVRQAAGRFDWWSADYGVVPIRETPDTLLSGDWSVRKEAETGDE